MKDGNKIIYHAIAWFLFITYEVSAVYVISGRLSSFADYLVHYAINIGFFYLTAYIVLPRSFKSVKLKLYLLVPFVLLALCSYTVLTLLSNKALYALHFTTTWSPTSNINTLVVAALFRAIYLMGLSTGYWFAIHYFSSIKKNFELIRDQLSAKTQQLQLEKAVIRSENAYLHAQVNPHLLFNTLNYIYNNVEEVSANAAEAVLLLADISRYSMRPPDDEGMSLVADELEQIKKLIRLNKLRFSGKIYIDYKAEGDFGGLRIAPLILLGFVENLFKHGDCSDSNNPPMIRVEVIDDNLMFTIKNRKSTRSRISHGIGISNTTMRLNTLYRDKYVLNIVNEEHDYNLNLSVKLDYAELLYS